ncbi:MAG: thioredoxin family protein [Planctomycetes bacterium]|nr:thioredoxin family protein [Planctomycetota bacterium]MCB9907910.1 thioredoxin family protein [Planctomycetota bacterium]MCB9909930.1 thioredoxin family protein [Planctomycetota bacterium]MCB9912933.1 thioredoxin family protein [Planctomycetota bacterium]HPF15505.1 thioredoxin family protein [Planctomycetota bacterium]
MSTKKPHPHFDDHGTLDWFQTLEGAVDEAKRTGRLIFMEFGRKACSQCRSLVEAIVPRPDVAELLQNHFVALAADADGEDDAILRLASQLPDAMMLPFVIFADAEGQFLEGYSGSASAPYLLKTLNRLIATRT